MALPGKKTKSPLPINAFVYPVKSYKKSKFLSSPHVKIFMGSTYGASYLTIRVTRVIVISRGHE